MSVPKTELCGSPNFISPQTELNIGTYEFFIVTLSVLSDK